MSTLNRFRQLIDNWYQNFPYFSAGKCSQALDTGTGSKIIEKFYFNVEADTCSKFTYKGAEGNENRFDKKGECELTCRPFSAEGNQALRSTYQAGVQSSTTFLCVVYFVFMPPTSEKLRGHIGLGLPVRLSVSPSFRNTLAAEKLKNRLC